MQTVILAAGRGTRMGELANGTPKPMLLLKGRPILEYTLMNLPPEIDEVIFVIGYKGEVIKNYFGSVFEGKKIKYIEQEELNGTGEALWAVQNLLNENFLVLYGDDLHHRNDLEGLIKNELGILVRKVEESVKLGVIEFDKDGKLKGIAERQAAPGDHVWCGACIMTKDLFKYPLVKAKPDSSEYGLPQTFVQMVDKYQIKVEIASHWHPNNDCDDLEKSLSEIHNFAIE